MHKFEVINLFNYDKLEECIRKSGKTRTYLCSQLGRPAYYLRDVIRQRNSIPEDYQRILADELGVTVAYLNDLESLDTKKDATLSAASKIELAVLFEEHCKEKGITPAFACQRAGVNGNTISRLRNWSHSAVAHEDILALASALECEKEAQEILGAKNNDPITVSDDEVNKMISIMRSLSPAQREAWMKIGLDVANLSQPE